MHPSRSASSSVRAALATLLVLLVGWPAAPAAAQERPPDVVVWIGAAANTVAGAALLDDALRQRLAAGAPSETHVLAEVGNLLGRGPWIAAALGGGYGVARLAGEEELARFAGRTFLALAAAGTANGLLKVGVGRGRPAVAPEGDRFRPLSLDDRWQSFPSGHTVTAFALATALAEQFDHPAVRVAGYGGATLVAWSRIHEDRHWASDVVAGALVGSAAAALTLRYLDRRERHVRELPAPYRRPQHGAPAALSLTPNGLAVHLPLR